MSNDEKLNVSRACPTCGRTDMRSMNSLLCQPCYSQFFAGYFKARAEVIEQVKIKVMEVIDERINAGMDDLEGADYKEFVQADFFIMAMGIVKSEVIKVLTKLSEGK